MFNGCSSLNDIRIPSGVTKIGYNAFKGCRSLKILFIPQSVTNVGYMICESCYNVTIYVEKENQFVTWDYQWNYFNIKNEIPVIYGNPYIDEEPTPEV